MLMSDFFKKNFFCSIFFITAGVNAAAPSDIIKIHGTITPPSHYYEMYVPITVDLGSVALDEFQKTPAASETKSKPLVITVSKLNPGQIVQFHLNAKQDINNKLMIANSIAPGNAINAGVVIHEHVNRASTVISPADGVATQDTVDEAGNVSHEFTVSMTPIQDRRGIVPGKISASATFTLELI